MNNPYTIEEIYQIAGKNDKTSCVTFRKGSISHKELGNFIVVTFNYTQEERENLDQQIINNSFNLKGKVRAKSLGQKLNQSIVKKLADEGIDIEDIIHIQCYDSRLQNTFHSVGKRSFIEINIPINIQKKGKDYDCQYHLLVQQVKENIGLNPNDKVRYLALKLFFNPNELTENEKNEILIQEKILNTNIEYELLSIKHHREIITIEESARLLHLVQIKSKKRKKSLDKLLKDMGSSIEKLCKTNPNLANDLLFKTVFFHERQLNINGKKAIYLDLEGFLHIYLRHVEEMRITKQFDDKDKFQWDEKEVLYVISKICISLETEIQTHFENHPNTRYSIYGSQSFYFEGDYYTFHIDVNGRISTFHKNRKRHDKKANR